MANENDLGSYIPIATPDTTTYPGSDYYVIALQRYTQQLHKDLPATQLQGYVQLNNGTDPTANLNTVAPPGRPYYLGPMIVAQANRPVRVLFEQPVAHRQRREPVPAGRHDVMEARAPGPRAAPRSTRRTAR